MDNVIESPRVRGRVFYTLKKDVFVGRTLQEGRYWEEWMFDYIRKHYVPGTDMIDIGGNMGTTTLLMEEVLDRDCQVHVFEPIYHKILKKTLDANEISRSRVVLYEYGVGKTNTVVTCSVDHWGDHKNFGGASLLTPTEAGGLQVDIPVVSIDSLRLKRKVSVVKIDVEGMELDVLDGMMGLIERDHPVILIEIWGHKRAEFDAHPVARKLMESYDLVSIPEGHDDYLLVPKIQQSS